MVAVLLAVALSATTISQQQLLDEIKENPELLVQLKENADAHPQNYAAQTVVADICFALKDMECATTSMIMADDSFFELVYGELPADRELVRGVRPLLAAV